MQESDVTTIPVGPIETNCYLFGTDTECCIVDPGGDAKLITDAIGNRSVSHILLTHAHYDHIMALDKLLILFPHAVVALHTAEREWLQNPNLNLSSLVGTPFSAPRKPDLLLNDGMELMIAEKHIRVIHTPGHTPGSCSFLSGDILFSGDTLFHSAVGRSDLPGSSESQLINSVKRLYELPGKTTVFPGHMRRTTIAWERRHNPFVRSGDL